MGKNITIVKNLKISPIFTLITLISVNNYTNTYNNMDKILEEFKKEFNQSEICLQDCHPEEEKRLISFIRKALKTQNEITAGLLKENEILEEALKTQKEEAIRKIEKAKEAVRKQTGSFKYDECYDDCIKIIKNYEK